MKLPWHWLSSPRPSYHPVSREEDDAAVEAGELPNGPHRSPPTGRRLQRLCAALLFAVLLLTVLASVLSPLFLPSAVLTPPVCRPLSSAYHAYLDAHARLRQRMVTDCPSLWARAGVYPRILVHECHTYCSGLGDRVNKAAGLFLLALLTNRSLFLDHTYPLMSDWYEPTAAFDWRVSGEVAACLEYGRRKAAEERWNASTGYTSATDSIWWEDHWGPHYGWKGWLRKHLLRDPDYLRDYPPEAAVWLDGPVNLLRPLEIASEFREAMDEGVSSGLVPHPRVTDDTFSSLLGGCLLSNLWQPSQRTEQLVRPLIERAAASCLVAVHVRYGDVFMFHFNASTLEGTETDRHTQPQKGVVERNLQCAVSQAHAACNTSERAAGLRIFFTTDAPRYNGWFHECLPPLRDWDRHHWGGDAFPSIELLSSPWEKPGNVVSFGVITAEERAVAEQQLISDWTMLSKARVTVTTGSVFSYTAASNALRFPIESGACDVRW